MAQEPAQSVLKNVTNLSIAHVAGKSGQTKGKTLILITHEFAKIDTNAERIIRNNRKWNKQAKQRELLSKPKPLEYPVGNVPSAICDGKSISFKLSFAPEYIGDSDESNDYPPQRQYTQLASKNVKATPKNEKTALYKALTESSSCRRVAVQSLHFDFYKSIADIQTNVNSE